MEKYISQKYDQVALDHLKNQIIEELTKGYESNKNKTIDKSPNTDIISTLRSQIVTLESEIYFLRGELKEKNTLIKTLVLPYTSKKNKMKLKQNMNTSLPTKYVL